MWPKRPASVVIDSAMYLLTISLPDTNYILQCTACVLVDVTYFKFASQYCFVTITVTGGLI